MTYSQIWCWPWVLTPPWGKGQLTWPCVSGGARMVMLACDCHVHLEPVETSKTSCFILNDFRVQEGEIIFFSSFPRLALGGGELAWCLYGLFIQVPVCENCAADWFTSQVSKSSWQRLIKESAPPRVCILYAVFRWLTPCFPLLLPSLFHICGQTDWS